MLFINGFLFLCQSVSWRQKLWGVRVTIDFSGGDIESVALCKHRAFTVDSLNPSVNKVLLSAVDKNCGKVLDFPSSLDAPVIQQLAKKYLFPSSILLIAPRPEDRACTPPAGFFTIYEDYLKFGLCLPLCLVFPDLLRKFNVPVGQIMLNLFRQLFGLSAATGRFGYPLTLELILRFFQLKPSLSGWFYLSPSRVFRVKIKSKLANWQQKFFFYRSEEVPQFI